MDLREHRYKKSFAIPNIFLGIPICMVLSLLVPWVSSLQAQDLQQVKGDFPLKNYSPDEYGAHYQNWCIVQDQLEFIYAGNSDGILEYDGVSWRLITWPGLRAVRCVTVDEDNIKWIGADRELGYLEPDSLGFLKYKSLKDKIPKSHPLTGNIWKVFTTRDEVLFVTDDTIYLWKGDKFTIVPSTGELNKEFQVNDALYFRIKERGLFRLEEDSLRLVPNGTLFKELRADVLFPYKGDSLLFVSRDDGVFVYDSNGISKMSSEVDEYLKENTLYTGLMLPDSTYALATLRAGVAIMDKNGKFLKKITVSDGMPTDQIHDLALDNDKGLWLAHQMGISRLEPFLPYTKFGKESGVEGTVWDMALHGGSLYAATSGGLYILESGVRAFPSKFRRVKGIERACLSILSVEQGLLELFALGDDNKIYQNSLNNMDWSGWGNPYWKDFLFQFGLATVSRKPNYVDLFAVGIDRRIYNFTWNGQSWSGLRTDLPMGTFISAPAVTSRSADRLDVLALGDDRRIYISSWKDGRGKWSDWSPIGIGTFTLAPSICSWDENRAHVFGRGEDRRIYHASYDEGSGWSNWGNEVDKSGTFLSGPTSVSQVVGLIDLYAVGDDQSMWRNIFNGTKWSGWFNDFKPGTFK